MSDKSVANQEPCPRNSGAKEGSLPRFVRLVLKQANCGSVSPDAALLVLMAAILHRVVVIVTGLIDSLRWNYKIFCRRAGKNPQNFAIFCDPGTLPHIAVVIGKTVNLRSCRSQLRPCFKDIWQPIYGFSDTAVVVVSCARARVGVVEPGPAGQNEARFQKNPRPTGSAKSAERCRTGTSIIASAF
jgi:hypothetical protein